MQFYRCKCGKSERWTTDGAGPQCAGCDDCGTTYARHPDDHKQKIDHDWVRQFDKDTGLPSRPYCSRCHKRGPNPEDCPSHVAVDGDPKVCRICGVRIAELAD